MPDAALHFSDVTFGFGKRKPLFEGLSCSLANTSDAGKIIALMGPSGVGKTTFCDLALGIRQPQNGSITFAPHDAKIALIPQKAVIFDELSVEENIACLRHSKTLGRTFQKNKIQHAVESLGLADVLRSATPASGLSGGEAQRVMLARIQTIKCDVLILDEPCSFLDNRVKDSFLSALRATVDKSRLLALMITHVWDEALLVADEVLFFYQAPGKAVTLHCHPIDEAQSRPPTIDALYGIHWPDCLVLDLIEKAPLAGLPAKKIPHGARFVGLHRDDHAQLTYDEWACELWNKITKPSRVNGKYLPAATGTTNKDIHITATFYNQNGVLLKSDGEPPY